MYSQDMTRNVIIAGGGIAGTVAALALRRAGLAPTVHEAHPAGADDRGAFLTVAVNGQAALAALGLDPAALAAGFPTPTLTMTNGAGRWYADLPLGGRTGDGLVTRTIRRADLYAALRDEVVRQGIPISYGHRLAAIERRGGRITAVFDDGSRAAGDLLVGADGLHSRTRSLLDPAAPAPRDLRLLNTGGFTDRPLDVGAAPGSLHMAFGRRSFFGWCVAPDGTVWWFANPPQRTERERWDAAEWRAYLLDLFADDAVPARAIVAATGEILGPWPTWDLPAVPVWQDGRVALVGDAAHAVAPSSGQGASMAMEDAVALARCLRDHAETTDALAAYERTRRPRVEKIVAYGRRSSNTKIVGPVGRVVRDLVLPPILRAVARRDAQRWILDHRVDWDQPEHDRM
jgi:FAD-dependent urate hydroxylase